MLHRPLLLSPSRLLLSRNLSPPRNKQVAGEPRSARFVVHNHPEHNSLLTPVHIPVDHDSVLHPQHPASKILENSALVIQRQVELGNILLGFEQANKYVVMDPNGNHIGFMAEEESGIAKIVARQWFRTHRAFTTHIFDKNENEVLRFHRPFSWINSKIRVFDPIDPQSFINHPSKNLTTPHIAPRNYRIVGEAQQQWHLWRRKYNLFLYSDPPDTQIGDKNESTVCGRGGNFNQFAYIDEPFLSWDFSLFNQKNQLIGSVNRNFTGFGREIFTDTGVYVLRMDAASLAAEPQYLAPKIVLGRPNYSNTVQVPDERENKGFGVAAGGGMTLDERAVMLAAAVNVDFDFFSRHSRNGGGIIPFGFPEEYNPSSGTVDSAATGAAKGAIGATGGGSTGGVESPQAMEEEEQLQQPPCGGQGGEGADQHLHEEYLKDERESLWDQNDLWGDQNDPWGDQ